MFGVDKGIITTTRMIDPREVALALLREIPLSSGILPEGALWWYHGKDGAEIAFWCPPQVWPAALQLEAFKPPARYKLPMPGLVFICKPGSPPRVYAAKRRPQTLQDNLYHAPLFNVFSDGRTCQGTHKFPDDVSEVPNSFFTSFFTAEADWQRRSTKYPQNLKALWDEINGKKRFPLRDLVFFGKVEQVTQ